MMASEVRHRYGDAMASEVVRAGAQNAMRDGELAGNQCRVRKSPGAEREIDPVPDQIEGVVREVQLDLGFRISGKVGATASAETQSRSSSTCPRCSVQRPLWWLGTIGATAWR